MQGITSIQTLHEAIFALESRRRDQERELGSQFKLMVEGLKPVNIIKNTFRDLAESPDLKHNILEAAIRIGSGYLLRTLFFPQAGPLKKIIGAALQFGIRSMMRKNGRTVKSGGLQLLSSFLGNGNDNGSR